MAKIFRTQFCKSYFTILLWKVYVFSYFEEKYRNYICDFRWGLFNRSVNLFWGQNYFTINSWNNAPNKLKFNNSILLDHLGEGVLIVLVNCLTLKQSMQRVQSFREMVFIWNCISCGYSLNWGNFSDTWLIVVWFSLQGWWISIFVIWMKWVHYLGPLKPNW